MSGNLLVEFTGYFNLEAPERYSDLFFLHRPNLAKKAFVTFALPRAPLTRPMADAMYARGITPIVLDPRATRTPAARHYWRWPKIGWDFKNTANTDHQYIFDFWRKLFREYGITTYVSWHRYDDRHKAIQEAIHAVGGQSVIYQRSLNPSPTTQHPMSADLAIVWGEASIRNEIQINSLVGRYLITGYLGDHRFQLFRDSDGPKAWRALFEATGVTYVIAFFDQNSVAGKPPGNELQQRHYRFLLERLKEHPHLGVIFKPKAPMTLRERLGPVYELLREAQAASRCLVLRDDGILSDIPPGFAAIAADLVIHGHAAAGTAGLEAKLCGTPTVFLNEEGWDAGSLMATGAVWPSWERLWAAIEQSEDFEWAPWGLSALDPYRDGKARERMADALEERL